MEITLYTIHCPQCRVLEAKIKEKNLDVKVVDNQDELLEAAKLYNIKSAPFLVVDGTALQFTEAIKWVREQ